MEAQFWSTYCTLGLRFQVSWNCQWSISIMTVGAKIICFGRATIMLKVIPAWQDFWPPLLWLQLSRELVTFIDYNLTYCLRLMSVKCFSTCSSPHYLLYFPTPTEDPFGILTLTFLNIQKFLSPRLIFSICYVLSSRASPHVSLFFDVACRIQCQRFRSVLVFYLWPWTCLLSSVNSIC